MQTSPEQLKVVIIGSGFGGQCAAIHLKKANIDDFVILERRSFYGGTWRQNTYPGAAVDVQSLLYSLSFEPYDWSRMFAEQAELDAYTQHVFEKYQLDQHTRLNANVKHINWDEPNKQWIIDLEDGRKFQTQFVINATGPLSTPVIPSIPGQPDFTGASFHTNDWQHDVSLEGKNVAIIGSGASAAQVIPAIVDKVKSLHVFQRTPHWLLPRWDWIFKPWQRKLLKNPWVYRLCRWITYWLLELRMVAFKYWSPLLDWIGKRPALRMLNEQVRDPELRKKLTPDFVIGCKRIIVSSKYYQAIVHPNTHLHDKQDGIKEINASGISTEKNGQIDLDIIVYATGYDASDGIISYPVVGRAETKLADVWQDFPHAYLGISLPKFPNLFIVTGPNTGIGHTSALFVIESQMKYIMRCLSQVKKSKGLSIEVKDEAEQDYTQMVHREMEKTVWHTGGCNSWYKSKSGKVTAMFPGFSFSYRRLCKRFNLNHHRVE